MDFVLGLHKTIRGVDMMLVVVDKFTKMTHFIPCRSNHDSYQIANSFLKEIVRIHGIPMTIVTNIDTKFIGHFWTTL